jgi:GAF domain-containing protein
MEDIVCKYYTAIHDAAKAINSSLDIEKILDKIVESVTTAASAKGCSLMLLSPDRQTLRHTAYYGLSEWYEHKGRVSVDISLTEALKGNAVEVLNAPEDHRIQYREEAKKEGIASILCVPVMIRDDIVGVVRLYTAEQRHFGKDDICFLGTIADLIAIAVEKARLRSHFRAKFGLVA